MQPIRDVSLPQQIVTANIESTPLDRAWPSQVNQLAVYPPTALHDAVEGLVWVTMEVSSDGSVSGTRVLAAYPQDVFDDAAINAVNHSHFSPKFVHQPSAIAPIYFLLKKRTPQEMAALVQKCPTPAEAKGITMAVVVEGSQ